MKSLGHIHHLLSAFMCLAYIIIMINGYPTRDFLLLDVPKDNYKIDFDEPIASVINKRIQVIRERVLEDSLANDVINSSDSDIHLKKKNSELISALIGLQQAMSKNYGDHYVDQ